MALPILYWCLPASRRWLFTRNADPRQYLQIPAGVLCMSMAFSDALCRYIPHRPLGFVHPAFFITTVLLVALLGPRVVAVRLGRPVRTSPAQRTLFATAFVALFLFPVSAVVQAFWF
jgi:hypothetical protein